MDPRDAWLLQSKRRIPVAVIAIAGFTLGVYLALVGRGMRRARASVVQSAQMLAARAPAHVSDDRNAALLWRQSFDAVTPWEGDEPLSIGEYVDHPETLGAGSFAPDSPYGAYLAANAAAIDLAHRAADLLECNWGISYDLSVMVDQKYLDGLRPLVAVLGLDLLRSADAGDWRRFEKSIATLLSLAEDIRTDAFGLQMAHSYGVEHYAWTGIRYALVSARPKMDAADVARLLALLEKRYERGYEYVEAIRNDALATNIFVDEMAGGNVAVVRQLLEEGDTPVGLGATFASLPQLFSYYSIAWADERRACGRLADLFVEFFSTQPAWASVEETYRKTLPDSPSPLVTVSVARQLATMPILLEVSWKRVILNRRMTILALRLLESRFTEGRWPASLADIEPDESKRADCYPPEGDELRYVVVDDSFARFYSVGYDCNDDGGRVVEDSYRSDVLYNIRFTPGAGAGVEDRR